MVLFVFFVLPIATILLAIVLQKILRCPTLVAITFFAIYLIVAFTAFADTLAEAIIATIIYTIIAFITAYIVQIICCLRRRFNEICNESNEIGNTTVQRNELLTINNNCGENLCNRSMGNSDMAVSNAFLPYHQNNVRTGGMRRGYGRMRV